MHNKMSKSQVVHACMIVFSSISAPVLEPLRCDRDDGTLYLRMKETITDHFSMFTSILVIIMLSYN